MTVKFKSFECDLKYGVMKECDSPNGRYKLSEEVDPYVQQLEEKIASLEKDLAFKNKGEHMNLEVHLELMAERENLLEKVAELKKYINVTFLENVNNDCISLNKLLKLKVKMDELKYQVAELKKI